MGTLITGQAGSAKLMNGMLLSDLAADALCMLGMLLFFQCSHMSML